MAQPKRPDRSKIRVSDIDDPLPDTTFGSVDCYVKVSRAGGRKTFVPEHLTLKVGKKKSEHVDPSTMAIFEVDLESRSFTLIESSEVDVEKRQVSAWVDHPGIYGVIGLPSHPALLETLHLLDRY